MSTPNSAAAHGSSTQVRDLPYAQSALKVSGAGCRGNRDGGDSDAGQPERGFDQDTASVVLRLLTVRATQRVLNQLMEFDLLVAQ